MRTPGRIVVILAAWFGALATAGVPAAAADDEKPNVTTGSTSLIVGTTISTPAQFPSLPTGLGTLQGEQAPSDEAATPDICDWMCTTESTCLPSADGPGFQLTTQTVDIFGGLMDLSWGACPTPTPPPAQAAAGITPAMVLQAFRSIPLPEGKLSIQPPGGKTLVNLETIFSTQAGDLTRSVTLLGQTVELRITASTYTWHHGDGTSHTTDWPGRAWQGQPMSQYVTHVYEDAHVTVTPRVDVTYSATYRVGGAGPWLPVDGTVTVSGPAASLRIVEARPVLVG